MLRKVVIADDDKKFVGGIDRALYSCGFQMVSVDHERDVLEKAKKENPAVIILSLELIQQNLIDIVAALKNYLNLARVPVFLISSEEGGNSRSYLPGMPGVQGYLKKPFSPLDLIFAIERAFLTQPGF